MIPILNGLECGAELLGFVRGGGGLIQFGKGFVQGGWAGVLADVFLCPD